MVLPIPPAQKVALRKQFQKTKTARGSGVEPSRKIENAYRKKLVALAKEVRRDALAALTPVLRTYQNEWISDAYAVPISTAFASLRRQYRDIDRLASRMATDYTNEVDEENRKQFIRDVRKTIGIDLPRTLTAEGVDDALLLATRENVNLITSIPQQFLTQIESAVTAGIQQGQKAESLIQQIIRIGKVTESRAKLIARDQTSKINGALNEIRQTNAGVTKYVWRTSEDDRVRPSHKDNNGTVFRWDTPPSKTGHPGHDINCRCYPEPVFELD